MTDAHDHEHDNDNEAYGKDEVHAHIGSYRQYGAVFMGLLFFTFLTVGIASIHLGKANLAVAVIIASIKAALVCTFFMHLKDDNKFNSLILIAAVTFIGVFFALTLNDVSYREKLDTQSGNRFYIGSGDKAPGSWDNPIKKDEKKEGAEAAPQTSASASASPAAASSAPSAP
jgi:cytochrome c oxidase subunit IV